MQWQERLRSLPLPLTLSYPMKDHHFISCSSGHGMECSLNTLSHLEAARLDFRATAGRHAHHDADAGGPRHAHVELVEPAASVGGDTVDSTYLATIRGGAAIWEKLLPPTDMPWPPARCYHSGTSWIKSVGEARGDACNGHKGSCRCGSR